MFWTGLNSKLNFTLVNKTYAPSAAESLLIYNPAITKDDWGKARYQDYKDAVKELYYFNQGRRCAYCRLKLRTDAYWDELDHIIPQSVNGNFIFYPNNLVASCKPCNSLKNATDTRTNPAGVAFPTQSNGFSVFNPHYDEWSDHFEIFRGIFLRGKAGTKGPYSYDTYKLYRYHITIGYSEELRYRSKKTARRLTHLLRENSLTQKQIENLHEAIKHIIKVRKHEQ